LNVDIKVNTAKVGSISQSLFSVAHTQDNIIGKATFKIENDFNGQTKNPSKSTAWIAIDNKTNIIINIFFMIAPQQMETQKHQNNHPDIGKATFKIENDFNGQTKNPSTKEFYLEKYGLKLGKQDLAFGMPRSNFNI
jgi:hypothetical protein